MAAEQLGTLARNLLDTILEHFLVAGRPVPGAFGLEAGPLKAHLAIEALRGALPSANVGREFTSAADVDREQAIVVLHEVLEGLGANFHWGQSENEIRERQAAGGLSWVTQEKGGQYDGQWGGEIASIPPIDGVLVVRLAWAAEKLGQEDSADTTTDTRKKTRKKKPRPLSAAAAACALQYRRALKADYSLKLKPFVDEWATAHGKSASSIYKTLTEHPDAWKTDIQRTR